MKSTTVVIAASLLLGACSNTGQNVTNLLEDNGVNATAATKVGTIVSNAVADGTLFCSLDGIVAAVPQVGVQGATASAVANACKAATVIGQAAAAVAIPVPPPATPTAVPVASVPAATVAAVAASVPAGS